MVLTKRERLIIAVTAVVVGLLLADRFVLGPLMTRRSELTARKDELTARLVEAERLLSRKRKIAPLWRRMREGLNPDAAGAESRILHTMRDAAEESGLDLSLLKPERTFAGKAPLPLASFQAAGTGGMRQVSRFLWLLETSTSPLRISELQLTSRKDGADEIALQLHVSTLHLPEPSRPTASATAQEKKP